MSGRPRRAAAAVKPAYAEVDEYSSEELDEYSSEEEHPKAKRPKAKPKAKVKTKAAAARFGGLDAFIQKGIDMNAAGRAAPPSKLSREEEEEAITTEEEEDEEEPSDAESSDADVMGIKKFALAGRARPSKPGTKPKPKAVRPPARRTGRKTAKQPSAKKKQPKSPKGKYAEDSTDHSSDYSTDDEDGEYIVVEYAGLRAQSILGWRRASATGPATTAAPAAPAAARAASSDRFVGERIRCVQSDGRWNATVVRHNAKAETWRARHDEHEQGGPDDVTLSQAELEAAMRRYREYQADPMEYLVKWKGESYRSCEWVPGDFLSQDTHMKKMLNRYRQDEQPDHKEGEEYVPEKHTRIERIIGAKTENRQKLHLCVWEGLPYSECTWEALGKGSRSEESEQSDGSEEQEDESEEEAKQQQQQQEDAEDELRIEADNKQVTEFQRREAGAFKLRHGKARTRPRSLLADLPKSPQSKCGKELRDYQMEGVNWVLKKFKMGKNCMLADEMGLGKTAQTVNILEFLRTKNSVQPFLIVAPKSTIPHWVRELRDWTGMECVDYTGDKGSRQLKIDHDFFAKGGKDRLMKAHVVVTTYDIMMLDHDQLKAIPWQMVTCDEAHRLKDKKSKTKLYVQELLPTDRRPFLLLLTGTPVQNNVDELYTMINLMDDTNYPEDDREDFINRYDKMKSENTVAQLSQIIRKVMLRRMKDDVVKDEVPAKEETIIWVQLSQKQKEIYRALLDKKKDALQGTAGIDKYAQTGSVNNLGMELRKLCNHPMLVEGVEEMIAEENAGLTESEIQDKLWLSCSKMQLLDKMLPKLRAEGHKVLIFSQMVRCLNILEDYMRHKQYPVERLDGNVSGDDRQAAIDRFSSKDADAADSFVFLLSTRAGGVGINLTAADTVIIYDSDWNPQNDLQAQARCHRIGQDKMVSVYRLVTKNCYEEAMFKRSMEKLTMDQLLLAGGSGKKPSKESKAQIENLIKHGAYDIMKDDEDDGTSIDNQNIEDILASASEKVVYGAQHSTFSKATFSTDDDSGEQVSIDDPEFWKKVGGEDWKSSGPAELGKRKRTATKRDGMRDIDLDDASEGHKPRYTFDDDEPDWLSSEGEDDAGGNGGGGGRACRMPSIKAWGKAERDRVKKILFRLGPSRLSDVLPSCPGRSLAELRAFACCLKHVMTAVAPTSQADGAEAPTSNVDAAADAGSNNAHKPGSQPAAKPAIQLVVQSVGELESEMEGLAGSGSAIGCAHGHGRVVEIRQAAEDSAEEPRVLVRLDKQPEGGELEQELCLSELTHSSQKYATVLDPDFRKSMAKSFAKTKMAFDTMRRLGSLVSAASELHAAAGAAGEQSSITQCPASKFASRLHAIGPSKWLESTEGARRPAWQPDSWSVHDNAKLLMGVWKHGAGAFQECLDDPSLELLLLEKPPKEGAAAAAAAAAVAPEAAAPAPAPVPVKSASPAAPVKSTGDGVPVDTSGLDYEGQRTAWHTLVRQCAIDAGRTENNLGAYVGPGMITKELAALGESNTLELIRLCVLGAPNEAARPRVHAILESAKYQLDARDNGPRAAFSSVNRIFGVTQDGKSHKSNLSSFLPKSNKKLVASPKALHDWVRVLLHAYDGKGDAPAKRKKSAKRKSAPAVLTAATKPQAEGKKETLTNFFSKKPKIKASSTSTAAAGAPKPAVDAATVSASVGGVVTKEESALELLQRTRPGPDGVEESASSADHSSAAAVAPVAVVATEKTAGAASGGSGARVKRGTEDAADPIEEPPPKKEKPTADIRDFFKTARKKSRKNPESSPTSGTAATAAGQLASKLTQKLKLLNGTDDDAGNRPASPSLESPVVTPMTSPAALVATASVGKQQQQQQQQQPVKIAQGKSHKASLGLPTSGALLSSFFKPKS
eukprot:COSAG01_NODE_2007_length_8663_cov_13.801378_3_plen_1886_part_00